MGAGHSHGSHRAGRDAELEVPRGPRWTLLTALALAGIAALVGVVLLWPDGAKVDRIAEEAPFAAPGVTFPTATVDSVNAPCSSAEVASDSPCGRIQVTVENGAGNGDQATIQVSPQVIDSGLMPGDQVRLQRTPGAEGADPSYSYFGTERTRPLLILLLVFVGLVLLVARWRGFFALVGLAFSGVVIWQFVLPALLTGASGVAVGLSAAALIMFVVLYTTHGFSLRTSGMRIGRDHIASTIYTIVFAYAGTALAVLLILRLYGLPWDVLLTTEDITQEIVRTLASSIGLVLAVPLTTAIATLVVATARPIDPLSE
jgi:uncharacterized membrane protein